MDEITTSPQVPQKHDSLNKRIIIIASIVIFLVVIACLFAFRRNIPFLSKNSESIPNSTKISQDESVQESNPKKTYKNTTYGFSFMHDEELEVNAEGNNTYFIKYIDDNEPDNNFIRIRVQQKPFEFPQINNTFDVWSGRRTVKFLEREEIMLKERMAKDYIISCETLKLCAIAVSYFKDGKNYYEVSLNDETFFETYRDILSTFTFSSDNNILATNSWKKFTELNKYVTFSYPSDYQIKTNVSSSIVQVAISDDKLEACLSDDSYCNQISMMIHLKEKKNNLTVDSLKTMKVGEKSSSGKLTIGNVVSMTREPDVKVDGEYGLAIVEDNQDFHFLNSIRTFRSYVVYVKSDTELYIIRSSNKNLLNRFISTVKIPL